MLLITLLLLISGFVHSGNLCTEDDGRNRAVGVLSSDVFSVLPPTSGCSESEALILQRALVNAKKGNLLLITEVERLLKDKRYAKHKNVLSWVKAELDCIDKRKVEHLKIVCLKNEQSKVCAKDTGYGAFLEGWGFKNDQKIMLNVCTDNLPLEKLPGKNIEALVFHELSHSCETADLEYYLKLNRSGEKASIAYDKKKFNSTKVNWEVNAGSFDHWYMNGFCIPGVNCQIP